MKQVHPNLIDLVTSRYLGQLANINKFKRLWGTQMYNGVEIFTPRKIYYPDMDPATEELAKFLGLYDQIKGRQKGIRSAWFYLNIRKAVEDYTWSSELIASNFNLAQSRHFGISVPEFQVVGTVDGVPALVPNPKGLTDISITIGPKMVNGVQVPADITTPVTDQEGLLAEIKSKYRALWGEGHTFYPSEHDPYMALLAMYILTSDDIPYEVSTIEETWATQHKARPEDGSLPAGPMTDQVKAWRVWIKLPVYLFTPTTDILAQIRNDYEGTSIADQQVRNLFHTSTTPFASEEGDVDLDDYNYPAPEVPVSGHWVANGTGDNREYYLRTSILTDETMKVDEINKYILGCIDTGYRKKKRKWYEAAIAAIIIIVIVVVSWGTATGAAGAGVAAAFGTAGTVALTMTIAAMYITLAAAALALMGAQNVASAMNSFLKAVAPLVQIASVITIIGSLYTGIKQAAQEAAREAAKEGVRVSVKEVVKILIRDTLQSSVGLTKLSNMTLSHVTRMVSFVFDIYKDMQMRDLQREIKNYRSQLATMAEAEERAQTSDLLKDVQHSYTRPLSNDWSYYQELYDRPYEWWATQYHSGNIQATTVNAMWLNNDENGTISTSISGER